MGTVGGDVGNEYVPVEVAGRLAGISPRTLRHWIRGGKLPAVAGKRGNLVKLGDVRQLADVTGKSAGNGPAAPGNSATSADGNADTPPVAASLPAGVSDAARRQLDLLRDEWLLPLVDRIADLERRGGRLEAERDQARAEADRLRAEVAALLEEQARPMGQLTPAPLWQPATSFPLAEPTSSTEKAVPPADAPSPSSTMPVENAAAPAPPVVAEVPAVPGPRKPWWRWWG